MRAVLQIGHPKDATHVAVFVGCRTSDQQEFENMIRVKLKEVMMTVDLEEVTTKVVSQVTQK